MSFLYNTAALRGGWDVALERGMNKGMPSGKECDQIGKEIVRRAESDPESNAKLTELFANYTDPNVKGKNYLREDVIRVIGLRKVYDSFKLLSTKAVTPDNATRALYRVRYNHLKDLAKQYGFIPIRLGALAPRADLWMGVRNFFRTRPSYQGLRRMLIADTSPYIAPFSAKALPYIPRQIKYKRKGESEPRYLNFRAVPWRGPIPSDYLNHLQLVKEARRARLANLRAAKKLAAAVNANPNATKEQKVAAVVNAVKAEEQAKAAVKAEQGAVKQEGRLPVTAAFGDPEQRRINRANNLMKAQRAQRQQEFQRRRVANAIAEEHAANPDTMFDSRLPGLGSPTVPATVVVANGHYIDEGDDIPIDDYDDGTDDDDDEDEGIY